MRKPLLVLVAFIAWLEHGSHAQSLLDVRIFGHRDFTRSAPENSLAALDAAVALGPAGAEIDLRTTKDGDVVLMHDARGGRSKGCPPSHGLRSTPTRCSRTSSICHALDFRRPHAPARRYRSICRA